MAIRYLITRFLHLSLVQTVQVRSGCRSQRRVDRELAVENLRQSHSPFDRRGHRCRVCVRVGRRARGLVYRPKLPVLIGAIAVGRCRPESRMSRQRSCSGEPI